MAFALIRPRLALPPLRAVRRVLLPFTIAALVLGVLVGIASLPGVRYEYRTMGQYVVRIDRFSGQTDMLLPRRGWFPISNARQP
jgi:hypothetical protein